MSSRVRQGDLAHLRADLLRFGSAARTRSRAPRLRPPETRPRRQCLALPDPTRAARPPRRAGAPAAPSPPSRFRRPRPQRAPAYCGHRPRAEGDHRATRPQPGVPTESAHRCAARYAWALLFEAPRCRDWNGVGGFDQFLRPVWSNLGVGCGSRLCENSRAETALRKSTSQIALHSTIATVGGVRRPPKTRCKAVFTQPRSKARVALSFPSQCQGWHVPVCRS